MSESGLRTGTKDYRTGFYKGTNLRAAKAGTMVQDQPTRPFVDSLIQSYHQFFMLMSMLTITLLKSG